MDHKPFLRSMSSSGLLQTSPDEPRTVGPLVTSSHMQVAGRGLKRNVAVDEMAAPWRPKYLLDEPWLSFCGNQDNKSHIILPRSHSYTHQAIISSVEFVYLQDLQVRWALL